MRFTSSLVVGAAALWASASAQEANEEPCEDFAEYLKTGGYSNVSSTCTNNDAMSECEATCSEGFAAHNESALVLTCTDGFWRNGDELLACFRQCEDFSDFAKSIPFAAADQACADKNLNRAFCPLVCQENYTPVAKNGAPAYSCGGDENAPAWEGDSSCLIAQCASLSSSLNDLNMRLALEDSTTCAALGTPIDAAAPYGEGCLVSCADGYEEVEGGSSTLTCTNGTWSGIECRAVAVDPETPAETEPTSAAHMFTTRVSFALLAVAAASAAALA